MLPLPTPFCRRFAPMGLCGDTNTQLDNRASVVVYAMAAEVGDAGLGNLQEGSLSLSAYHSGSNSMGVANSIL